MHHIIVHQHLYQPPREDPWLEAVPTEPSASPDHDWNARINRECYARLGATESYRRDARADARDPDARAGLARIVNMYAWCSFDAGATLCEWLDAEAPETMAAMRAGDAASQRRWGHGNAIAAPYHHVILPLASPRERRTEIRWGIRDFQRRFGREPSGLWLPECAVNDETLEDVAREGIAFVILAPYQVHGHDESGMPIRWRGANGRSLAIVPYDGALAGDVAFGGLLRDPMALAMRLTPHRDAPEPGPHRCTTLATDGETFGHHHRGGEVTLLEALSVVHRKTSSRITNAAALVALYPPTTEAHIVSPSAWSCAHGIERWRSDCGCRIDGHRAPAQGWRGALRRALEQLAQRHDAMFAREGSALFRDDPWDVRDRYGDVVAQSGEALEAFVRLQVIEEASDAQLLRARALLELARASMRTFTSCAWFFDDVDRIEVRQVLRYAARAIELAGDRDGSTSTLLEGLREASSGAPNAVRGSDVYLREAVPARDAALCAAASAIAGVAAGLMVHRVAVFDVDVHAVEAAAAGHHTVTVSHRRTGTALTCTGFVEGEGPAQVVTLTLADQGMQQTHSVPLHEFPESMGRLLLRHGANNDSALASELVSASE